MMVCTPGDHASVTKLTIIIDRICEMPHRVGAKEFGIVGEGEGPDRGNQSEVNEIFMNPYI
jgi:hypothetical protein